MNKKKKEDIGSVMKAEANDWRVSEPAQESYGQEGITEHTT